jgi:hypothetical protein
MALTGAVGYLAGIVYPASQSVLPVQQSIPFECYLNEQSFSEIENTKSTLDALCQQFLTELQIRHDANASPRPAQADLANPLYRVDVAGAIQELRAGIQQFKGIDQELTLVRELLFLLKKQKQYDQWLDVYLAALYAHPMHELIGSRAKDAEQISAAVGRQSELANAFDLLRHIPLQFPAKDFLATAKREKTMVVVSSPAAEALAGPQPLPE